MDQRTSPTAENRSEPAPQLSLVRLAAAVRPLVIPSLVAGLLAAALVTVWVHFFLPARYSSAALLLVQGSSGRENTSFLGLQGYQQLLESDEVVSRTTRQLQKQFPNRRPQPRVGRELISRRIGDGKGGGESARLLRLEAHGSDPEVTAATAEIWMSAFLDKCETLARGTTDARAKELEEKLEEANSEELGLHGERRRLATLVEGAYQGTLARWDRRVAQVQAAARQELADFDGETQRQVHDFETRHQMEVRRLKVATLADAYRRLALSDADNPIEDGDVSATEPAAETAAPTVSFEYVAPSEEVAPLDEDGPVVTEPGGGDDPEEEALSPEDDVVEIKRKLMIKADKVRRDEALLDRLKRERQNQRRGIEDRHELELQVLERQRQTELYSVSEAQAEELTTVERQLRDAETVLTSLVRRRSVLDVKRSGCEVEVAAAAVRPARSEPRRTLPKALIGLVVGAMVGFLLALAREVGRAGRMTA